jgi:hypothetical protein
VGGGNNRAFLIAKQYWQAIRRHDHTDVSGFAGKGCISLWQAQAVISTRNPCSMHLLKPMRL